ncbi:DUF2306 domain-containing protein [Rhizohabitans arisaemae]|uniref:DUF2306 domain-containing protein n=1 Tax=Rhizohabitans arisaemae TaxID=2720610 RepID=UPI0024B22A83|nr:DUF2306 domain-containing protein [Rhizohabitans arisaemae]
MSNHVEQVAQTEPRTTRRRRPWVGLLALLVVAFLLFTWPSYLTFDPATANIPIDPDLYRIQYPLLVLHIAFGSVAMIAGALQLWPWLRRRHRAVHRATGRIYIFGGVGPAAVAALIIMPMGALNVLGMIGTTLWAVVGLGAALLGALAIKRGRRERHRQWMIYSFAAVMAPITGRLMFFVLLAVVPGGENMVGSLGVFGGFWLGWIVNLALAYWRLRRVPVLPRR